MRQNPGQRASSPKAKDSHIQHWAPAGAATQATGGAGTKPGKAAGREGAVNPGG